MRKKLNERLPLHGFIDPSPQPAFLVPVFTDGDGLFLQVTNEDGTVISVSELPEVARSRIKPASDRDTGERSCAVGEAALYAFQPDSEHVWTDEKAQLTARLGEWLDQASVNPLLRFEILEFMDAPATRLAAVIEHCEHYLDRAGVRQSSSWAKD